VEEILAESGYVMTPKGMVKKDELRP